MTSATSTIFSPSLIAAQPLACRLLETAVKESKVANAYLLVGRSLKDKLEIVRQLCGYLNCQSGACLANKPDPSGYCLNCKWIVSGQHPQALLSIDGEGKSGKIPVEKVRLLTQELGKTSACFRVVTVPEADEITFHRPAANALLKSIEEPPDDCLFFFFADSVEDVLPTIVSRCQVVPVSQPLPLAFWPTNQPSADEDGAQLQAAIEATRSALIMQARRNLSEQPGSGYKPYFKSVSDAVELSKQLQELHKELQAKGSEDEAVKEVLDLYLESELVVLRQRAWDNARCASYLNKLSALIEKSKARINQYIKANNVLDTFGIAACELREEYLKRS